MEPRIQYAQTSDGVSIAFRTLGEGMPVVYLAGSVVDSIQMWSQISELREWKELLAARWKVVEYDRRGNGLSQRDAADFSLDALVLDLEAVVDRLALGKFAVYGVLLSGPVALAYAARHPERVSHLILWNSYARGADLMRWPRLRALWALRDADWETFIEAIAHLYFPDPAVGAAFLRESATPEVQKAFMDATAEHDVMKLLPGVRCPTLVLYSPGDHPFLPDVGMDTARDIASRIPGASLAVVEGPQATLNAVDEFLAPRKAGKPRPPKNAVPSGPLTILFTDVEGSTAMTQRLGDAKAREVLREHERIVREALKSHGGSEVKTMGDGFMASFGSATKALECAIAMQRAFAKHNESAPEPIVVRVGLNAGEPIAEEEDLHGTAVIEAARITAAAAGGEILVANVVRELAKGKGFLFGDRGEAALRGFDDPVRLFEVRWREE